VISSLKNLGNKDVLIYLILILVISYLTNFFYNTYFILKNNHESRLKFVYGYCAKESYGYVSSINKKFEFNGNIKVINKEMYPSAEWFFYKVNKPFNPDYLILLNYKDKSIFQGKGNNWVLNLDTNRYDIIDNFENCFFLKKSIND